MASPGSPRSFQHTAKGKLEAMPKFGERCNSGTHVARDGLLGEALCWAWQEEQCWQCFSSWLFRAAHPGGCKQQPQIRELDLEGTSHAAEMESFQGHGAVWDQHHSSCWSSGSLSGKKTIPITRSRTYLNASLFQHSHSCWVVTGRKSQSRSLMFSPCIHVFVIKTFQLKTNLTPVMIRISRAGSTHPDPKERL